MAPEDITPIDPAAIKPGDSLEGDSWFDRFHEALRAGEVGSRSALEAHLHGRNAEERQALEALWTFWSRNAQLPEPLPRLESMRGRYHIVGVLGRGGMGIVYEAIDSVLERTVALKTLRSRSVTDSAAWISRFRNEARLTAGLEHPGIVPVYDLVHEGHGEPFYTMLLVKGRTLAQILQLLRASDPAWPLGRVAGILLRLCETIAYAHSRGVVHRDLKPSNVMVGDYGQVCVLDWGLARSIEERPAHGEGSRAALKRPAARAAGATEPEAAPPPRGSVDSSWEAGHSSDEDIVGTPPYLAPEQARGYARAPQPAADVYSLGALLYASIAQTPPYVSRTEPSPSHEELLKRILDGPPQDAGDLRPEAPPELVSICRKAMARDPAARYDTARAMAEDLRAWQEGRVVPAHKVGMCVALRKWVARNRMLSSALALLLLAITFALVEWAAHTHGRMLALEERKASDLRHLYSAGISLSLHEYEAGRVASALGILESLRPHPGEEDLRGFEWWHLWSRYRPFERQLQGLRSQPLALEILGEGKVVAAAGKDGPLLAWDATTGRTLASWRPRDGSAFKAAIARSGVALVALRGGSDAAQGDRLLTLSLAGGTTDSHWEEGAPWQLPGPCTALEVSADGVHGAIACGKLLLACDLAAAPPRVIAHREGETSTEKLVMSPSGARLLCRDPAGNVSCLRYPQLELLTSRRYRSDAAAPAFVWDDRAIALAARGEGVILLPIEGIAPIRTFPEARPTGMVRVLPSGDLLLGSDGDLELWDNRTQLRTWQMRAHPRRITRLQVTPDGRWALTGDTGGSVFFWNLQRDPKRSGRARPGGRYETLWPTPDGSGFIAQRVPLGLDRFPFPARGDDSLAGVEPRSLELPILGPTAFDLCPATMALVYSSTPGQVEACRLDWASEPPRSVPIQTLALRDPGPVASLGLDVSGSLLAAVSSSGRLSIWQPSGVGEWRPSWDLALGGEEAAYGTMAISPSREWLAYAHGRDPEIILVSLAKRAVEARLQGHESWVLDLAFSSDSARLASGSLDSRAALWEVEGSPRREPIAWLIGHANAVTGVVFLKGDERLATSSDDSTVRIWSARTGQHWLHLSGPTGHVNAVAASPDGAVIVGAGHGSSRLENELCVWSGRPAETEAPAREAAIAAAQ